MNKIPVFVLIMLAFFGCNASKEDSYVVVDSLNLNLTYMQINNKVGFGLFNSKNEAGFYFLDNDNKVTIVEEGKETMSRHLVTNGLRIDGVAFDIASNKLYYTQDKNLYQVNKDNITLKVKLPKLISDYTLSSLTFEVQPKIYNDKIYLNIIDTVLKASEKIPYVDFCKKKVVLEGKLSKDHIPSFLYEGKFPSSYREGNHYNNYYCNIEYDGTNLLMSFSANDSVFVKDDKGKNYNYFIGSKNVRDDIKPVPFDDLKINSRITNYVRNSARYIKLIYDPYRKRYLRVYQIKNDFNEGNSSIKWGIAIFDDKFTFLKDIVFDSKNYTYLLVSPCQKGLIISKSLNNYANEKIKFDIISID